LLDNKYHANGILTAQGFQKLLSSVSLFTTVIKEIWKRRIRKTSSDCAPLSLPIYCCFCSGLYILSSSYFHNLSYGRLHTLCSLKPKPYLLML